MAHRCTYRFFPLRFSARAVVVQSSDRKPSAAMNAVFICLRFYGRFKPRIIAIGIAFTPMFLYSCLVCGDGLNGGRCNLGILNGWIFECLKFSAFSTQPWSTADIGN